VIVNAFGLQPLRDVFVPSSRMHSVFQQAPREI